jgi:hypothetical protein
LRAWQERKAEVGREATDTEHRAKAVQQKLDRLDEAFLFAQSIDITTYEPQRDRLRQELTLTDIDRPLRPSRENRRGGHPGLRRTRFTEGVGLVGAGVVESATASSAAVFPRRHRVRRKTVCSNCGNRQRVQILDRR